jgi:REP element-mobilizing transposase RayT
MRPWHLTISSVSRLALFPTVELLRRALWKLVEILGDHLVIFCVVDDHVHVVIFCDEEVLASRVRALTYSVRTLAAAEVNATHVTPVESRRHMLTLLGYVLGQPAKHGLPVHPALWEGSCLVDLVGARLLPGLQLRIMEALPRATQQDALEAAGLGREPLEFVDRNTLRSLGPARLMAAAAAATATDPRLGSKGRRETDARRATCHLAKDAGIPMSEIAWHLDITSRACRRLLTQPRDADLCEAVRRRLALEERVIAATRR